MRIVVHYYRFGADAIFMTCIFFFKFIFSVRSFSVNTIRVRDNSYLYRVNSWSPQLKIKIKADFLFLCQLTEMEILLSERFIFKLTPFSLKISSVFTTALPSLSKYGNFINMTSAAASHILGFDFTPRYVMLNMNI